ncbi:MAG: SRPBCC domain-containing protein [Thermomicrobiales bacterium]|nr:SRPBCC domain-containing protein [Thermomicrobiales bacterium]
MLRICTLDLRPGGVFHYCAQRPNGAELWGKFVYHEIVPSARLVCVSSFSDETGCSTHNSHASERPLEILNIWTFQDHGGRTILTGRGVPHVATEAQRIAFAAGRKALRRGLDGPLNRLADYLGSIAR